MNTPENSLQTATRWAWTGAKVAYSGAVLAEIFSPTESKPVYDEEELEILSEIDLDAADEMIQKARDLRVVIDQALKIQPDDHANYLKSALYIVEKLEELKRFYLVDLGLDFRNNRLLPRAKREEVDKVVAWAKNMHEVWDKIRVVRQEQAKVLQDMRRVELGETSPFWIAYENADTTYFRWFKYYLRFVIIAFLSFVLVIGPLMMLCLGEKAAESAINPVLNPSWLPDFGSLTVGQYVLVYAFPFIFVACMAIWCKIRSLRKTV